MNKILTTIVIIGILFVSTGCVNIFKTQEQDSQQSVGSNPNQENTIINNNNLNVVKLEILHFHPNTQCYNCRILGEYAEVTIATYFANELKNGKIIFRHVNYESPENQELLLLYRPPGSALCIGVYDAQGGLHTEENYGVWYRLNNKDTFMNYLKNLIDMRLNGDLTQI